MLLRKYQWLGVPKSSVQQIANCKSQSTSDLKPLSQDRQNRSHIAFLSNSNRRSTSRDSWQLVIRITPPHFAWIRNLGTTPILKKKKNSRSEKAILGATLGIPGYSRSNSRNGTHDLIYVKTLFSEQLSERLSPVLLSLVFWVFIKENPAITKDFLSLPNPQNPGKILRKHQITKEIPRFKFTKEIQKTKEKKHKVGIG